MCISSCHLRKKSNQESRAIKSDENGAVVNDTIFSLQSGTKLSNQYPTCLSEIGGRSYKTLLDTGSSKCFVKEAVAKRFGIRSAPFCFEVGMAQSTNKVQVSGLCRFDIKLFGQWYDNIALYVMKNLCVDVLLGCDFLKLHESLLFQFGGTRNQMMVLSKDDRCAVSISNVKTPSLFSNLTPGWKPIATKSRTGGLIKKTRDS